MRRISTVFVFTMLLGGVALADQLSGTDVPDFYPPNYAEIIEASKSEDGVLIYGNIAEYNWRYVLEGFKEKYPWITKIQSLDLGPTASFERYYAEKSIGKHTADMMAVGSPDGFQRFADKESLLAYSSPESEFLPDWSYNGKGLYTISADPMVIIYNKLAMPESDWPSTLADIAELAESKNSKYRNRITTYDASKHSFAYDIHWNIAKFNGDSAWELFDRLGSISRGESGAATMVEKVTSGEYMAGYFVSGIGVFPRMNDAGREKILGWSLIEDGTPIFIRGMALTRDGKNPNSAKLLLDYILSHEGQVAVAKGGLTPYRQDLSDDEIPYLSFDQVVESIGEENVVRIKYNQDSSTQYDDFMMRWKQAYRIEN